MNSPETDVVARRVYPARTADTVAEGIGLLLWASTTEPDRRGKTGVVEGNGAQLANRKPAATTKASEMWFFFMRVVLDSWANVQALAPPAPDVTSEDAQPGGCQQCHCVCPAWAQSKWGSSPLYENQKP